MGKEDAIREFMPTGFHEHDKEGRPLMIINAGQVKLAEIMKNTTPDTVTKFIIRELEHSWREKFDRCEQVSKQKVDQMRLLIDMRGGTLKQIANKQLNLIWGELQRELSIRYPELVSHIHIVNTPMFFESFFNSEIRPKLTPIQAAKIEITGESSTQSLLDSFDLDKLPATFGGKCTCGAQCIYSDKGPWSDVLNVIDFQNRQYTITEAEFYKNKAAREEEFKMLDNDSDDDEQVDLLGEENDLNKIKMALKAQLPGANPNQNQQPL